MCGLIQVLYYMMDVRSNLKSDRGLLQDHHTKFAAVLQECEHVTSKLMF